MPEQFIPINDPAFNMKRWVGLGYAEPIVQHVMRLAQFKGWSLEQTYLAAAVALSDALALSREAHKKLIMNGPPAVFIVKEKPE